MSHVTGGSFPDYLQISRTLNFMRYGLGGPVFVYKTETTKNSRWQEGFPGSKP